ncbi:MAG TPA: VWA domain-containing protein [Pyrinomonadaceae bacterium]|nr:VWA domain-containing protein [Acidobacteriota bacterium]HQZ96510.1 VWA domain-containing protein [Pyrinomonadaceae bacterium]
MRKGLVFLVLIFGSKIVVFGQDSPPVLKGNEPAVKATPPVVKETNAPSTQPAAKPSPSPDDEIISVETNLVTTPVSVLDRNGRFIPGLKKKDFKIYDNGVLQDITYFQSEEQPFTVILMIDISPSTKYKMDEIHYAAVTFVNQLRPTDKVLVVAFDQRVRLLTEEATSDKQKIYSAIYKSTFGSGTSLYEAVSIVTDLDLIKVSGRKAVVLFTDGVDTTSRQASFESTVAGVQEVDALIYPIRYNTQQSVGGVVSTATGAPAVLPKDIADLMAARGITIDPRVMNTGARGTSPAAYAKGKEFLEKIAEASGGRIFEADDLKNLEASFAGVAEELRRQYSIGYYPENPGQPGERRYVKIKVIRPNTVVRAKNGYVIRQTRSKLDRADGSGIFALR